MGALHVLYSDWFGNDEWWLENCENNGLKNYKNNPAGRCVRRNSRCDHLVYCRKSCRTGKYNTYDCRINRWSWSNTSFERRTLGYHCQPHMGVGAYNTSQ